MAGELVSMILGNLNSKIHQEMSLVLGVKDEIAKLSSMFRAIQAVLNDAENREVKEESIKIWLQKLKDVAYHMDNVLDEWHAECLKAQIEASIASEYSYISKKVRDLLFSLRSGFSDVQFRNKIAHKIKDIAERLEEIKDEKDHFGFLEDMVAVTQDGVDDWSTSSLIDESNIFGRGPDKERIMKWLLSNNDVVENPLVISIVGMAGIGKSTLAQLVYNDDRVKDHFGLCMWINVSVQFDVSKICEEIIEANDGRTNKIHGWNLLHNRAKQMLKGKRFLLVLDDVWNDSERRWEQIKLAVGGGSAGSRILVTTRNEIVAKMMSSTNVHNLEQLFEQDCWSLFSSRAQLERRPPDERLELEAVGGEIVRKCGGVPLAIKVIGSALRSKREKWEWERVLESDTWNSPEFVQGVLPALVLSYYNMPSHLKQCFAFLSVFPKHYLIEKDQLIKLWMAQGFIPCKGKEEMETTGQQYFDDLMGRSLLDEIVTDIDGYITHCRMHGFFHDLFQSVASDYFIDKWPSCAHSRRAMDKLGNARHCWLELVTSTELLKASHLRTLIILARSRIIILPSNAFLSLGCLRALDLSGSMISTLPDSMGDLKHMRYLNLSATNIEVVPELVTNFCQLQTLKLNECKRLMRLPLEIRKMVSLRHLEIDGTPNLQHIPNGIGRLKSLRTMSKLVVGDWTGCKIGELEDLNLLEGNLTITCLRRVQSRDESRKAKLEKKKGLRALTLTFWESASEIPIVGSQEETERLENVYEDLRPPHTNLRELELVYFPGAKLPSWLGDSIYSNLVKVVLRSFIKCRQLPPLGRLPSLKILTLDGMNGVEFIGCEFHEDSCASNGDGSSKEVFPKLEVLTFTNMNKWKSWESRFPPRLLELEIASCIELQMLPRRLPSTLRKLTVSDCPNLTFPRSLPPELEELKIDNSRMLSSNIWGQLRGLRTLHISSCHEWSRLPDEIQHFTNLLELRINTCPYLEARCHKVIGKDWPKIAHIRSVYVNGTRKS